MILKWTHMPKNAQKIQQLEDEIESLKKICRDFKKKDDNEMCSNSDRKKAGSGQHGIKDNVTYGQLREGLEERIDQLKRDLDKENRK